MLYRVMELIDGEWVIYVRQRGRDGGKENSASQRGAERRKAIYHTLHSAEVAAQMVRDKYGSTVRIECTETNWRVVE